MNVKRWEKFQADMDAYNYQQELIRRHFERQRLGVLYPIAMDLEEMVVVEDEPELVAERVYVRDD